MTSSAACEYIMIDWLKAQKSRVVLKSWRFQKLCTALGLRGALGYRFHSRNRGTRNSMCRLRSRNAVHPLYCRNGTSDLEVFNQIFVDLEYEPLRVHEMLDVQLVLDCGANVGYSSAYFLSQSPSCHVIAVEPDPGNFAMLQRNLLAYGERAKLVRAGIWSHDTPLTISQAPYRDGREWTIQVRPCEPNEKTDLQGVSIESLLASSGFDKISLLKVDIEGAEVVLFGANTDWLERVDAIVIELHDDSHFGKATDLFNATIDGRGFEVSHSGELTLCRRPSRTRHYT
jgi:FkbM family methyltransferase